MKQSVLFAAALVVLAGAAALAAARWGDAVPDAGPAALQMREQFDAIEKSAGIVPDRHGCDTPRKFVPDRPFHYQCPIAATQLGALRTALAARGWQAAAPAADAGDTYSKGALRSRLNCDAAGKACMFRLETLPGPAAP
jgi:hypothetical protein